MKCVGVVGGTKEECANVKRERRYRVPSCYVPGLRVLESSLVRTMTRADRRFVRHCFGNRRFSMRRVHTTVEARMVSKSVMPITVKSGIRTRKMTGLLSSVIHFFPDPSGEAYTKVGHEAGRVFRTGCSFTGTGSTCMFGAVISPFVKGCSFMGMYSKMLGKSSMLCGTSASTRRGPNGLCAVYKDGPDRIARLFTNSVKTVNGLAGAEAKSALSMGKAPMSCTGASCSMPCACVGCHMGGGNSRSGMSRTLTEVATRSIALGTIGSDRGERSLLCKVNRRRLRVMTDGLTTECGMRVALRAPGITFHRAVHGGSSISSGCGGRDNKRKRCKRIGVGFRPSKSLRAPFMFRRYIIKKTIPGGCFPTMRGNLRRSMIGKPLTKCPMINIGTALCSKSCRPMSSSRVTFGATAVRTFGGKFVRTSPMLLRPVTSLGIAIPSSCAKSVVKSLGGHEKHILNVVPMTKKGRIVRTSVPVAKLFNCYAALHSVANKEKSCRCAFTECRRTPSSMRRGRVTTETRRTWLGVRTVWEIYCPTSGGR